MEQIKYFKGENTEQVWHQFEKAVKQEGDIFSLKAVFEESGTEIHLLIDIDLGGGFQSGISTTSFTGKVPGMKDFKFALHHQHFIDEIGKFFGMEDIVIGYEEFDDKHIIKTNSAMICKELFAHASTRKAIQSLDNFTFYTEVLEEEEATGLFLIINEGITELKELKKLYKAFQDVLVRLKGVV
jgi:hypothetical protein